MINLWIGVRQTKNLWIASFIRRLIAYDIRERGWKISGRQCSNKSRRKHSNTMPLHHVPLNILVFKFLIAVVDKAIATARLLSIVFWDETFVPAVYSCNSMARTVSRSPLNSIFFYRVNDIVDRMHNNRQFEARRFLNFLQFHLHW